MANFPRMNLSPEATPWGREAQQRIEALESENARLRQDVENALRVNAGALTNIGRSLSTTYTYQSGSTVSVASSNTYVNYSGSEKITFTLAQPSKVLVVGSARMSAIGVGVSGGPNLTASFGVYVDAEPSPWPSSLSNRLTGYNDITGASNFSGSLTFSTVVELETGTHIVGISSPGTQVFFTGASSGSVQVSSMFFSATVLGAS